MNIVHARASSDEAAYLFLANGEVEAVRLSHGELDAKARAIAAALQEARAAGERALLLYPAGLDFIAAFLGCLFAGVVAVPAYPPRRHRVDERLRAIAHDCRPAVCLTTGSIRKHMEAFASQSEALGRASWIATDELDDGLAETWREPEVDAETLAFVQYTSGSTGSPKGVLVRHGHLLHNEEMIRRAFGHGDDSLVVGWLPLYHDMGLIGNVLQPLYLGSRCVLMSPMSFLQKPLRWLEAISRYGATTSGGPNFAYELCVQRIGEDERRGLDLSSWRVAYNGAEPVRAATLERFAEAFAPCGFRREAFYPCYGLAEATLFVTGGRSQDPPRTRAFDTAELERDRAVAAGGGTELVACGRTWGEQELAVVDPATGRRAADGSVGEIWLRGPSVAGGYFEKPEATARDFAADLEGAGPYLRTGDLGFVDGGELFVTGRLKDLVILRGRNLYPHDLESAAEASHPFLRAGASAAFSVEVEEEERLALVLELHRRALASLDEAGAEAVATAVRQALAEGFEAPVHAVVLIRTGTLPKTSSGKIRRRATREAWLDGELEVVSSSVLGTVAEDGAAVWSDAESAVEPLSRRDLLAADDASRHLLLVEHLRHGAARAMRVPAERVPIDRPLTGLGLDSLQAMELRGRLETELGFAPDVTSFLEGASVEELAGETLAGVVASGGESAADARSVPAAGETEGEHPLSFGQEALWFLHRLAPDSAAYNIAAAARLRGALDTAAFGRAFEHLAERHPALRTRFHVSGDEVVQEVRPPAGDSVLFRVEDATGWDEDRLGAHLAEEAHRPFDLREPPLLRVTVLRRGAAEHVVLLAVHHVVADFWSLAVLLEELGEIYSGETAGRPVQLEAPVPRYTDWVRWQRERLAGPAGRELEAWWLRRLSGDLEPLDLATDRPRPPVQTFTGAACRALLEPGFTRRLRAASSGATLYTTLLAAWQAALHRYTGQRDLLVGSPTSGRDRPELAGLVGYFVNPLVMRADLTGEPSWDLHLERTRRAVLDAFRHQDQPFDLLVERLRPERRASRSPVFQVFFTLQQAPRLRDAGLDAFAVGADDGGARLVLGGLEWEPFELETRSAQFELALAAAEHGEAVSLALTYNSDLFDAATIRRLLGHLRELLAGAIDDPARRLSDLPLLAAAERRQVLVEWNDTAADGPAAGAPDELCLHELVEARARRTPDAVALVFEDEAVSYGELVGRSARLAARLRRLGAGPDVPVGLCMVRSVEMTVGLLGILMAGGAFIPLDPGYPEERLTFMLDDAFTDRSPRLLVTRREDRGRLGGLERVAERIVEIDGEEPGPAHPRPAAPSVDPENPSIVPLRGNLAYVIYTSGSTGRPKGVQIPHRAVVNFLESMRRRPGLGAGDVLAAVTTLAFDIAVLEVFLPLVAGARVVLFSRETAADSSRLDREIAARGTTVMQATPATWRLLLESGWQGREGLVMLCGGEALESDVAERLRPCGAALWNMYGPTETTIWSAVRPVGAGEDPVLLGGPIANTRLHLLDARLAPVPAGVPGEVWIGGDGLARGYRGRPALTGERFVPDPLAGECGPPGGRLYRVGDLARYLPGGELEFLGRVDHQVKVRGYRIELGEIESVLAGHPRLARAVVVVNRADPADPRLVAWLVPSGEAPSPAELRGFLRHSLPDYMVPSAFVAVDELPHTPNGKIDRSALTRRSPAARPARDAVRVPRTTVERTIAGLWCEVLGVASVGLDDNFFDLGGHSLLVTRLHRLLGERLERDDLTVVDLFQYTTVGSLARYLAPDEESAASPGRAGTGPATGRCDVAIVGMAGRFPGAGNVAELWRNLRAGREAISFFSDDELLGAVPEEVLADPRYVRARGVLDGAETFDAAFFGYTPRDAEVMDPQHRLFLECAWEALEDAAYDPARFDGRIGLYAGVGMNSYLSHAGEERLAQIAGSYQAFISNDKDFVPTRVSYKLDLRGPSINVQTACSSSLVAVHLACQSLFAGESDMALAGGVTVRVPQVRGYVHEAGGILSPDGHCRAFDAEARGTVLGNGLGAVVLKPLERALDDGDRVLAVIKGSAINNDGAKKIGYTAPSVEGQTEVVRSALEAAGIPAESVSYIETHGTGTELGDPIEVTALVRAFGGAPNGGHPARCALGSVKTNIGHLDTAAGVAGLIKTVEALRHGEIPPSLHFERPNPRIPFEGSPFRVNRTLVEWPADGAPRRAGVSSFGIGGTNAHVVLEEAPKLPAASPVPPWQLLLISARTPAALDAATDRLAAHLRSTGDDLADIAYTLQVGRHGFDHRRWLTAGHREAAAAALESRDPEAVRTGTSKTKEAGRRVVFLFSGQGSQYVDMGRQLYDTEPVFRHELDRCAELLAGELGLDLRTVIHPGPHGRDEAAETLRDTRFTQPALFAIEYALARLWMSWGVAPAAMLGHSIGELVAATLAGVFHFDDAVQLVAHRGRLMGEQPPGAMLAVGLAERDLVALLGAELQLAVVNGPADCVVSGPSPAIASLERRLGEGEGEVRRRRLHTSHAFHSAMMRPAVEPFVEEVGKLRLAPPRIPFVSNVTGTWITDEEATDPRYWGRQLAEPVRFADGVAELAEEPGVFLEVGPGHTLVTLARPQARGQVFMASLPHAKDGGDAENFLLGALGRLWQAGVEIDWPGFYFYRQERRRRVELPTYPFERRRFWIEPDKTRPANAGAAPRDALARKADVKDWIYASWWMPALLDASTVAEPAPGELWLVVASGEGSLARLSEHLAGAGRRVVHAVPGARFEGLEGATAAVDPLDRDDWAALLDALGEVPRHVVHAGAEVMGLIALVQALARLEGAAPIHLTVVTQSAFRVEPGEPAEPEAATLWGIARTVPQELPRLDTRMIDVDSALGEEDLDDLGKELLAGAKHREVALRSGGRYTRTFDAFNLPPASDLPARLASGGPWLVTGGLGGVGLALARALAGSVPAAKLVLLGRGELPPRAAWESSVAENGAASRAVRGVLELEALGAEVLTLAADVADRAGLETAVAAARERFGPLRGVIHAAGVAGGGRLDSRRAADAAAVLWPKVEGTRVLMKTLDGDPLDFVLLCSSINAVAGGYGQADYAAANAFLDAFAEGTARRGGPLVVSLGWDRWRGVGMSASTPLGAAHPLLGMPVVRTAERVVYRALFAPETHWVLAEHEVAGRPTVPGATYLEMARAAWAAHAGDEWPEIRDVVFPEPLAVDAGTRREVLTVLDLSDDGAGFPRRGTMGDFQVLSRPLGDADAPWQEHSRGRVSAAAAQAPPTVNLAEVSERMTGRVTADEVLARSTKSFLVTGHRWGGLDEILRGDGELLAEIVLPDDVASDLADLVLHPALLDIGVGYVQLVEEGDYLPLSYERLVVYGPLPKTLRSHLTIRGRGDTLTCDAALLDEHGTARAVVEGFSMKRVGAAALAGLDRPREAPGSARPEDVVLEGTIEPAEAAEVLRRVLAARRLPPHLVVSPRDFEAVREAWRRFDPALLAAALAELGPAGAQDRPDLGTAFVTPEEGLEKVIAETWRRYLGIEAIGSHDNFFELGGTSLVGVQVVGELKRRLGREIPTVSLFEAPTIAALAKYLEPPADAEPAFAGTRSRMSRKKAALAARKKPHGRRAGQAR